MPSKPQGSPSSTEAVTTLQDDVFARPYFQAQTIAVIKPDAVARKLLGTILDKIEDERFDILRAHMVQTAERELWESFYSRQHGDKEYFPSLVEFMASGPSLVLLLRRPDAISTWRRLMGPFKNPREPHTIRGEYMLDGAPPMKNLVHGSDGPESFLWEFQCLEHIF